MSYECIMRHFIIIFTFKKCNFDERLRDSPRIMLRRKIEESQAGKSPENAPLVSVSGLAVSRRFRTGQERPLKLLETERGRRGREGGGSFVADGQRIERLEQLRFGEFEFRRENVGTFRRIILFELLVKICSKVVEI